MEPANLGFTRTTATCLVACAWRGPSAACSLSALILTASGLLRLRLRPAVRALLVRTSIGAGIANNSGVRVPLPPSRRRQVFVPRGTQRRGEEEQQEEEEEEEEEEAAAAPAPAATAGRLRRRR